MNHMNWPDTVALLGTLAFAGWLVYLIAKEPRDGK